ncbi:MAG: ketol-acid reductoisomerase, partial [Candidatus Blochmannia sp. A2]|nr:ketol-acid reductoisomerase [Candidatus Blochmannia sp. A2]
AGIELSFETMVNSGILYESAYYESLHELPLIANTIARRKLYEMNKVISDTAEYGSHLFSEAAYPILKRIVMNLEKYYIGTKVPVEP